MRDENRRVAGANRSVPQSLDLETASAGPVVVRETVCKSILNRSSIDDYSLNCYTGCTHACVYCYARYMQRFHPHPEPWGQFVDVKINAVETLHRQLRRATPGEVFVSSACDGWQPLEADRQLTRRCCELLIAHGFTVNLLTKSALVLRDFDVLTGQHVHARDVNMPPIVHRSVPQPPLARVGVTVTTLDEDLRALWEPGTSSVAQRFGVIEEAKKAGLRTAIMFGPLLPFLSDDQESIESLLERAGDLAIDVLWVDALNARPRVWPAVAELLRKEFPDLHAGYRRLLFDKTARADYLTDLGRRVSLAASRLSLTDRVRSCV
jgi:DNA repair photolyase